MQLGSAKAWDAPQSNADSTRSTAQVTITRGVTRRENPAA